METKEFNKKCPYCGSKKMTADCDIIISGTIKNDKQIIAKDHWVPKVISEEAIASLSQEDIQGYCEECGSVCDFDWKKGFVPGNGIDHNFTLKEAAKILKNIITYVVNRTNKNETVDTLFCMGLTANVLREFADDCRLDINEINKHLE